MLVRQDRIPAHQCPGCSACPQRRRRRWMRAEGGGARPDILTGTLQTSKSFGFDPLCRGLQRARETGACPRCRRTRAPIVDVVRMRRESAQLVYLVQPFPLQRRSGCTFRPRSRENSRIGDISLDRISVSETMCPGMSGKLFSCRRSAVYSGRGEEIRVRHAGAGIPPSRL